MVWSRERAAAGFLRAPQSPRRQVLQVVGMEVIYRQGFAERMVWMALLARIAEGLPQILDIL